jgi:succinate dehydrogenase hydrophobic anchor subunit
VRRAGVITFALRRASGVLLTAYLAVYIAGLARTGSGPMFIGDAGRSGGIWWRVIEVALIVMLAFHALDGGAHVLLERLGSPRKYPRLLGIAIALSVLVGALHALLLFG